MTSTISAWVVVVRRNGSEMMAGSFRYKEEAEASASKLAERYYTEGISAAVSFEWCENFKTCADCKQFANGTDVQLVMADDKGNEYCQSCAFCTHGLKLSAECDECMSNFMLLMAQPCEHGVADGKYCETCDLYDPPEYNFLDGCN